MKLIQFTDLKGDLFFINSTVGIEKISSKNVGHPDEGSDILTCGMNTTYYKVKESPSEVAAKFNAAWSEDK